MINLIHNFLNNHDITQKSDYLRSTYWNPSILWPLYLAFSRYLQILPNKGLAYIKDFTVKAFQSENALLGHI